MNHVVVSGNLVKEPELRSTSGGTAILSFGIAVNDRRKNGQTGEWEDIAHFVDCILFGKRAESLSKILRKGSRVYVDGRLSQSRWEDKNGNKRSKIEIVANDVELPPRNANQGQQQQSQGQYQQQPNNYPNQQQYGPQNGSQQPMGGYQGQYQQQGYQQPEIRDVYDSDIPFGG